MSDIQSTTSRPQHHIHGTSDPLPGAKGSAPAPDYSAANIERAPSSAFQAEPPTESQQPQAARSSSGQGQTAFNSERPFDTQPTPEGSVAVGGQEGLPEGKAGIADKVIGKTQKVVGKATRKPEMHEKGELREAGGKGAVAGTASVPHD